MKNKIIAFIGALLMVTSCADPDLAPIITFDSAGKGAYAARISETAREFDFFNLGSASYTYTIEFIDIDKGNTVTEYNIDVYYDDRDGTNGDISAGPVRLRAFSAADFETNDNGNKGLSNISFSANDLITALGLDASLMSGGDRFRIDGEVVTQDGQSFRRGNSSASVNGAAFRGHLGFNISLVCASNLEASFDYSTEPWCGGPASTGSSSWVRDGDFTYDIPNGDFSYGAYDACYGGPPYPEGSLLISDACNNISITGTSQWGEVYTINSLTVNGNVLVMDWENTYGEAGVSTLTRTDGSDWPPLKK